MNPAACRNPSTRRVGWTEIDCGLSQPVLNLQRRHPHEFRDVVGDTEVRKDVRIEKVERRHSELDWFGDGARNCWKLLIERLELRQNPQKRRTRHRLDDQARAFLAQRCRAPGQSSISRGIRNAWLRPFLKRRTCRSVFMRVSAPRHMPYICRRYPSGVAATRQRALVGR